MKKHIAPAALVTIVLASFNASSAEASVLSQCIAKKCSALKGSVRKLCQKKCALHLAKSHTDCPHCKKSPKKS